MKLAITGYNGFIGSHLVNSLIYKSDINKNDICLIDKKDFESSIHLKEKLLDCDSVIHLAGVNRHEDPIFIYNENIRLTKLIIQSISEKTKTIIFSSSIQQDLKNPFGESKLKCCQLFSDWAITNNTNFVNLKIPNIFGAFGKPNYNSFISTFCNNLIYNKEININNDNEINLLYIDDLIENISSCIAKTNSNNSEISKFNGIVSSSIAKVFEILKNQWDQYHRNNTIPNINSKFEMNLFNTLRSFIPHEIFYPKKLVKHIDERGFFSEIIKTEGQGQFSVSTTNPGITRGNHFHTRKIERFIVAQGKALVELRKIDTNEKLSFILEGSDLNYIDIPIWYTHNIKNIGKETLVTMFWINESYDPENSDTYFIKV